MSRVLAIWLLLSSAIVGVTKIANADGNDPAFMITTKRDDDKVEVQVEQGKATVSIHSPFGISQAVIQRRGENWPDSVMLRLHLKGLENLKIVNGATTLRAAVSSHGDKQRVRIWVDDREDSPLDAKSPFWMTVRMVGEDGKPTQTIPLIHGYFEMQLPRALLEDNPKSITLNWIDFYR